MSYIGDPFNPLNFPQVQQGWQCPCCRRVYAPHVMMCFTCGNNVVSATGIKFEPNVPSVSNGHPEIVSTVTVPQSACANVTITGTQSFNNDLPVGPVFRQEYYDGDEE